MLSVDISTPRTATTLNYVQAHRGRSLLIIAYVVASAKQAGAESLTAQGCAAAKKDDHSPKAPDRCRYHGDGARWLVLELCRSDDRR